MHKNRAHEHHSPPLSQLLLTEPLNPDQCIVFISLSHYEMHKLVHDPQHFLNKVRTINNQAKKKIDVGAYKEALILLNEGEKILQYAAGSGKTIQRDLIICILHNIACVHQKLWCLDKCISYVEGLLFNLENHLNSLQNSVVSSDQNQGIAMALQSIQMKNLLAEYSIRFCALNSQRNNHKQALSSSKKSIGYLRNILTFDENYLRKMCRKERQFQGKFQLKIRLLNEIIQFQNNINMKKHKQILKAAHFCLQIWNKNKEKSTSSQYKFLKNYSIGDFMDLKSKDYTSKDEIPTAEQQKEREFSCSIVFKIIMLSISFFSTSTEMRLNISEDEYYSQIQKQYSFHYKEAEIYHLMAIILITGLFSFEILYIKHVLASYTSYFNAGLLEYKTVEAESLEKVISLISDSKYQMAQLGSTEIISSDQNLPEHEVNQYRLKDKLLENKAKQQRKPFLKYKKKVERSDSKRNSSKNFSSLQNKSVIKEGGYRSKNAKDKEKQRERDKTKSKHKSRPKTLQKKSKSKEREGNYYFIKPSTGRTKRKIVDQLYTISKKVSPVKQGFKELGSEIVNKNQKKLITTKGSLAKKRRESKSAKHKQNIYGLDI